MSTFQRITKHPVTGEFKKATWYDNHFGGHHYGVQFEGEKKYYDADDYVWEFGDDKNILPTVRPRMKDNPKPKPQKEKVYQFTVKKKMALKKGDILEFTVIGGEVTDLDWLEQL